MTYRSSLISTKQRVGVVSFVAIVDVNAVQGYRLSAVTDFLAFMALSRRPIGPIAAGTKTIASLFAAGPHDASLTDLDRVYLRGLYAIPMDRPAARQQSMITAHMLATKHPAE